MNLPNAQANMTQMSPEEAKAALGLSTALSESLLMPKMPPQGQDMMGGGQSPMMQGSTQPEATQPQPKPVDNSTETPKEETSEMDEIKTTIQESMKKLSSDMDKKFQSLKDELTK